MAKGKLMTVDIIAILGTNFKRIKIKGKSQGPGYQRLHRIRMETLLLTTGLNDSYFTHYTVYTAQ